MSQPTFFSSRGVRIAALLILFISAFAIRLYDLTDPPLDFHPTRQLLSAIKARAYFYETKPAGIPFAKVEEAKRQAKLKAQVEPEILEQVVAFTYRFTGEKVWVARIYSSLFWIIGGIFLFLLVRDLLTFDAAILSTAYYLFFPYAVMASRSFQPDPLMVMLIVAFWWAFARWMDVPPERNAMKWGMALLAGLLGGLAILVKFTSAFFVIGAALGLVLSRMSVRQLLRNGQVWVIAFLGALPGLIYLINGLFIQGGLGSQFSGRFVPALLLDPFNYLQWTVKMDMAAGGFFIMLALLGFFLTSDRHYRFLMFGLWGGYLLYSLYFNYHAATHDYYQLPFIPIVAVSLGPLGRWFFARLAEGTVHGWQRSAAYFILIGGLFMVVWNTRNQMKAMDYRPQVAMWAQIGKLTEGKSAVGLVGDYGSPLEYYGWKTVPVWPYTGDTKYARGGVLPTEKLFEEYSSKRDYFIVTDFEELARQPALKKLLMKYPVLASGNGFVIYNLEK
ncbi:MAG: ArnT family glycosyltransferase [Bacteroidota bacterium]